MGGKGSDHRSLICMPCHSHATYNQLFELKFQCNQNFFIFSSTRCAEVTRHAKLTSEEQTLGGPLKTLPMTIAVRL